MYTILAIDDTQRILDILQHFLQGAGYTVKTASDPLDGIKIAQEGGVDLILLDILMPQMDGYRVYEVLKKDDRTRDIPVLMLTAKAVILHTPKDFFYGLYGFISKPFTRQQLLQTVNDILGVTRSSDETQIIEPEGGNPTFPTA